MARLPRPKLEWSPSTAPLAQTPVWQQINAGILSIRFTRGRSFRLDQTQAGTCTIRLLDLDGELDSKYTGSPWYGYVWTRKKFRISMSLGGSTWCRFTGFLRGKPRFFPGIDGDEVELRLTDGFLILGAAKIETTSDYPEELSGTRLSRVLSHAHWPDVGLGGGPGNAHRSLDAGSSMISACSVNGRMVLEHILHVEQSEMGRFFIDSSGKAIWLSRHTLLSGSAYTTPQVVFGGPGGIPYQDIVPEESDDLIYTEVRASRPGGEGLVEENEQATEDFGLSTLNRGTLLLTSDSEVDDILLYLLDRQDHPVTRFRQISVIPLIDESVMEAVMDLDLGYRATVNKRHRRLGYTESQAVQLEQITETIDYNRGTWQAQFQLSDADTRDYWKLADLIRGLLGTTTIFGL